MITPHPVPCALKHFLGPQKYPRLREMPRKREKVAGPRKLQRATGGPAPRGKGPRRGHTAGRRAVLTVRRGHPPQATPGQLFRHRRHRPAGTDHPGHPHPSRPHLPLWRCEPAAPAPISSYYWTGAPAAPPQTLSTTEKEKGSCVRPA